MRLSIDHRTSYRFSAPQARLVQLLRLTPQNTHDQTVAQWRIDVDCDAQLRPGRDGFGNCITMLYVHGPVESIELAVSGEVLTSHSSGVLHGTAEPLPPQVFLRATEATAADPDIAAFAQEIGGKGPLNRLHRLNDALHARFTFDSGRPLPGLDAAAAFAQETATARDMAQMFLVAARSLDIPARYVSGYRRIEGDGDHRPTPHGWAEAHVEGIGWVAFDPCVGRCPEDDYVRVAVALDAAGAAPVAGSRLGEGAERLDVDVNVTGEE
jgi:transglutaminase-like putative cysteine protease